MWWWCSGSYTSSSDAVELFRYIRALPRLKTLEISMMKRSLDIFDAAFESPDHDVKEFMLPKIEHLVVNSSAAFLASHCPRLKTLVLRDSEDCLLDSYTDVAKRLVPLHPSIASCASEILVHFDATAIWCPEELSRLVRAFPRLQYLRMRTDTYCYRASTPDVIETLSGGLNNLQSLHLVKSGNLNMGYQSVWKRRIPASSDEEYRRALWLENERLRVSVENTVARLAFREIVALNEIWLGEKRVARRMRKDSDDGLKWLWEREREGVDTCGMATGAFLRFKLEKEAVVVTSEVGR
ncbi:hypothetical protein FB567DRAFT_450076 [Paraphoma chrysanthemicola]|uniref:F-box domain-containing protein n=1 Tax=Paraphoma chrysanthemicola TaxID=798071 RepID=A0A8K0QZB4_9PLEO|nr:hypothetical protein FB567DRAFT_450076 [Paraphoma chrysanthemicola]